MNRNVSCYRVAALVGLILPALSMNAAQAAAPSATTDAATGIAATTATLNGTVTANGASTAVTFEWGLSAAYGSSGVPAASPLAAGAVGVAVSWPIGGLLCETAYHFHVIANNGSGGDVDGGDRTFTPSACPPGTPSSVTGAATAITTMGATLNGTISSNGTSTHVAFLYGLTGNYTNGIGGTPSTLPPGAAGAAVSASPSGLTCGTLYHFAVVANNGIGGDRYGADHTLTTSPCPSGLPAATSANTNVSDIWWNPSESGWGLQLVDTGNFVFATAFVYGTDGKPTWFTGELESSGPTTFTGPLYLSTGPYFGGPFNPPATGAPAGTMTFVLTSVTTGQLHYSVNGVVVDKTVERQPLTVDNFSGNYLAGLTQTVTGCLNPAKDGIFSLPGPVDVTQNGSAMVVTATNPGGGTCTLSGPYSQLGRMGQVQGPYTCTSGEVGTATMYAMSLVPRMFTARLQYQSSNFGCTTSGEVVAVLPR